MNNIDLTLDKNRLLYRELFLKANKDFHKQINLLKSTSFCNKCRICCNIRYSYLSPQQINELSQQESVSKQYKEQFLPYGAQNYTDELSLEQNHEEAKKVNEKYVKQILAKEGKDTYFYYCKNLANKNECTLAPMKTALCSNFPDSISVILPYECGYREWLKQAKDKINNDISLDIVNKLAEINAYRDTFKCKQTGTCCKLASSEFSYEELKLKTQNGDNFAAQFTSVFIPYKSEDEARKIYPDLIDYFKSKYGDEVYFYHCPHVTEDNLCSIYEARPQICRDFPDNPLTILPPQCSFCEWKDDVEVAAMLLHALIEISEFNLQKINKVLE